MGESERIGFERQIVVGEAKLRRLRSFGGEIREDRPIGEIGGYSAIFQRLDAVFVARCGNDFRVDFPVGERFAQALLGGRARQHADLFARQRAKVAGPRL